MENILTYQESTETIRQMPQNYLIAEKINGKWVCDPDPAADKELVLRVFNEIFDHHTSRWGTGLQLLSKVTPNKEFKQPKPTNLNPLFIDQIRNFAHLVTPEPQTKDQFIHNVKLNYDVKNPKTDLFVESIKLSDFDTIRLNDTRDSILFNQ